MHGPDWHAWPAGLRDPRSAQVARARSELLDRVDFHCWLTWLTDSQLGAAQRAARDAGMAVGMVHDLAVGVHPSGSDAWAMQDVLAAGMSVGAPPDAFNSRGQDWGLPPWRPDALAATGYAPYRDLICADAAARGRTADRPCDGPVPAVVGAPGPPADGGHLRPLRRRGDARRCWPWRRTEAGAVVIGEDLGTVEPGVREELADRGILGTSVLWFERDYGGRHAGRRPLPPAAWRECCLATATTHDLPSTAARLTGEHVGLRHRLGLLDPPAERGAGRGRGGGRRVDRAAGPARAAARGRGRRGGRRQGGAPLPGAHPGPDGRGVAAGRGRRPPPAEPAGHLGRVPQLAAAGGRILTAGRSPSSNWPPRPGCTRWPTRCGGRSRNVGRG